MIALQPTADPHRFALDVTPALSVGPPEAQFLFGGAGLAASVAALEAAVARPVVWAAAQYLSYARPPATLDLDVVVPVLGKHNAQARVTGHVGDTEILTVNAALGSRAAEVSMQWPVAPPAPPPEDCPAMTYNWRRADDDVNEHLDLRTVSGRFGAERDEGGPSGDGRSLLWARPRDPGVAIDRVLLALLADFLPSGVGHAIGRSAGGNSLDNTIRYVRLVETGWVLLDTQIDAAHAGFVHGSMRLFAEDGTLMALGSQSMILRMF